MTTINNNDSESNINTIIDYKFVNKTINNEVSVHPTAKSDRVDPNDSNDSNDSRIYEEVVTSEFDKFIGTVYHCNNFTMRSANLCMLCKNYSSDGVYCHMYRFSPTHLNAVCLCTDCIEGVNPIIKLRSIYIYDIAYLVSKQIYGDIEWVRTCSYISKNDGDVETESENSSSINIEKFNGLRIKRTSGIIESDWSFGKGIIGIKHVSDVDELRVFCYKNTNNIEKWVRLSDIYNLNPNLRLVIKDMPTHYYNKHTERIINEHKLLFTEKEESVYNSIH